MNDNRDKIGWCDASLNLIVGCTGDCWYCYARRQAKRQACDLCEQFKPHFHRERLSQLTRRQAPRKVFLCSMGDWGDPAFGGGEIQGLVESVQRAAPQHVYILLTKRPAAFRDLLLPDNWCAGVSVTGCLGLLEQERDRITDMLFWRGIRHKVLSYEPVLGHSLCREGSGLRVDGRPSGPVPGLDWTIFGGLSGGTAHQRRSAGLDGCNVAEMTVDSNLGPAIFVKENYRWASSEPRPKQFPTWMAEHLGRLQSLCRPKTS